MEQKNGKFTMKLSYLQQPKIIPLGYLTTTDRDFVVLEDIQVTLSDKRTITIPKGYITDLSSKPKWLWSLLPPFDKRLIAAIIHDYLWTNKLDEIKHHKNIYKAFSFSNKEFDNWNNALSPNKNLKNWVEYNYLQRFSMPYYTGKKSIGI